MSLSALVQEWRDLSAQIPQFLGADGRSESEFMRLGVELLAVEKSILLAFSGCSDVGRFVPPESKKGFDVPVTRQISPKNGKNWENQTPQVSAISDIFCDWVSIYQTHNDPIPLVNDGCVMKYDGNGELEFTTLRKFRVEGSHESAVFVRSDGHTVWFEGNVSRIAPAVMDAHLLGTLCGRQRVAGE